MNDRDRIVLQLRHDMGKLAQERTDLRRALVRICEIVEDAAEAGAITDALHQQIVDVVKEAEGRKWTD